MHYLEHERGNRVGNYMRKREVIEPNKGDKRYARRDEKGQFSEDQVDMGKSLAADQRKHAKTIAPKGMGDKGDQKRPKA